MENMESVKNQESFGEEEGEAIDSYKIAYIIHYLLGAGNLLPWNALITTVDYFGYLYPGRHIEKVFSVAYMGSSVFILVVLICCGGWKEKMSFRLRMNLGFSMFVVSLLLSPVMDWTGCGKGSSVGYGLTVLSVVVCGLADGLIAGSLIGSAGNLAKQYMQAVFAGTASSGVLISILRVVTKALLPQTPQGLRTSAHFYFIVTTVVLLFCIAGCNLLYKLPVMQKHYTLTNPHEDPLCLRPKFWAVARKIRWPASGIVIIYIVTLSIFPGFIAENLKSQALQDWYPILLITVYNIADLMSKSLTAIYVMRSIKRATWACVARLLFYALFVACLHGPNWLRTEAPMVVLAFLLGLTNGYLTSVIMILAPKSVPAWEAELSALVMTVS